MFLTSLERQSGAVATMSTPSDTLRPLGMLEKIYTARHVLNVYNSVVVTATYALQLNQEDSTLSSLFCAAIPRLLRRHPSLCCYFEGEDTPRPQFKRLEGIEVHDVLQIIKLEKQESLAHMLQRLHDQRWPVDQKPLWKLVVMREEHGSGDRSSGSKLHVAFVYHHVIADGLSGAAFHRTLRRTLKEVEQANLAVQETPKAIDTPTSVKLIEPIERLIPLPLSWLFLIKQVLHEYAPRWLIGAPLPIWAGLPMQTLDRCAYRSRNRIVTIEAVGLARLLKGSRKHGVSLTSLLTASLVSTLANALPEAPQFLGNTAYTLRRVTGISMDEMVNQSSAFPTSYPADVLNRVRTASDSTARVESLWDFAIFFHRQLQDEIARCPKDNLIGLLPYVFDHIEYHHKKFGRAREATLDVSNLGVLKTAQESSPENWKLESMTFTQGAQPLGSAFAANCVSVQDGPLTIALTWQDSVVDESIIDALARGLQDLPNLLQRDGSE